MKWLREPLLHFLLIGSALFGLYYLANPSALKSDHVITVDENTIEHLKTVFERSWNHPPTRQQLESLVNDYILEEIFYRQALALGLDKNDSLIRRRLKQKMELLVTSGVDQLQPTEQQLNAFLQQNAEDFKREPRITFQQVYISTQGTRSQIEARLERVRSELEHGNTDTGDPTMLPAHMNKASTRDINRTFGLGFADQLLTVKENQWSEPVQSGFGLHFVRVSHIQPGQLPTLTDIRPQVEREWLKRQGDRIRDDLRANLLADYKIEIEWPGATDVKTAL